jgi:hypothetical protein
VIAEVVKEENDVISCLALTEELPTIKQMYNSNGSWYLLESLWSHYLGIDWGVEEEFLFNDSMHMEFIEMDDQERWDELIAHAHRDIDNFFSNLI